MSLVFQYDAPAAATSGSRADVACFIGFVARRAGAALPAAVRAQLQAAGWIDGIWARPAAQVESLDNLPVMLDSWELFDRLFAWERRPLTAGGGHCAGYLGAAVRSFFARGGRCAVVIRVGDPWPLLESAPRRASQRRSRIRRMLPDYAENGPIAHPFDPSDPSSWQGIHHLYGLRDPSMVALPDLADACAVGAPSPKITLPTPVIPQGFAECSAEAAPEPDTGLRHVPAPRLDASGYAAWMRAVESARGYLVRMPRETLLVAGVPLPHVDAHAHGAAHVHAQADMLGWLDHLGVFAGGDDGLARSAGAQVQLVWPWLRTLVSGDVPEGLEPPEGLFAGIVAGSAMARGCHRSVAGNFSLARLRDVLDAEPQTAWSGCDDSPEGRLARRVCVVARQPDGWALQSDVTLADDPAWRFGGASRLMANLLRVARGVGETLAFEPNGPATWARLKRMLDELLDEYWREGALAGSTAQEAYSVRCDRSTMTQADLDGGRLVAAVSVVPAVSIERITVVLRLNNAVVTSRVQEAA